MPAASTVGSGKSNRQPETVSIPQAAMAIPFSFISRLSLFRRAQREAAGDDATTALWRAIPLPLAGTLLLRQMNRNARGSVAPVAWRERCVYCGCQCLPVADALTGRLATAHSAVEPQAPLSSYVDTDTGIAGDPGYPREEVEHAYRILPTHCRGSSEPCGPSLALSDE